MRLPLKPGLSQLVLSQLDPSACTKRKILQMISGGKEEIGARAFLRDWIVEIASSSLRYASSVCASIPKESGKSILGPWPISLSYRLVAVQSEAFKLKFRGMKSWVNQI